MPLLAAFKLLGLYSAAKLNRESGGGAYMGWMLGFEGHMYEPSK